MERRLPQSIVLSAISLLLIISPCVIGSEEDTAISFTDATLIYGTSTSITLHITDATNISILSLNITWDPSVIKIEEVNTSYPHSDFDSVFTLINNTRGILEIDAYKYGVNGLSDDISVLQLTLTPLTKGTQETSTTLEITGTRIYDSDQQTIAHTVHSQTIPITSEPIKDSSFPIELIIIVCSILFIACISVFIIRKTQQKKH